MNNDRYSLITLRYEELTAAVSRPEVFNDLKRYKALMKEKSDLEPLVERIRARRAKEKELADAQVLLMDDDPEMAQLAQRETQRLAAEIEVLDHELEVLLLPKDPNDEKNVVIEIKGAAGGEEANLFAADLFRMYTKYAEDKGWKLEVTSSSPTDRGGFSDIAFMLSGDRVYSFLKYESGAHRVQRVPATESQGRVHTSTATVLVMPEADEIDIDFDLNDVRIDTFCSSGPGGQSVNTTKSAVRVTHVPTGIVVSCQDGKSQNENKANALKVLKARLYDQKLQEKRAAEDAERMSKIGRGDRSEKIRTYNYPQNRVTDHRIGFTIQQLDRVMEGELAPIVEALIAAEQAEKLEQALSQ